MLGKGKLRSASQTLWAIFLAALIGLSLVSCDRGTAATPDDLFAQGTALVQEATGKSVPAAISEISPPPALQTLGQEMEEYQPQVKILSPRSDAIIEATEVTARVQVQNLSLYKDEKFGLGPHLHIALDNQPGQEIYDTSQPITFSELQPGTHTIRVFASRPWHESFKNEGSYAQVTFHVFTKTLDNRPDSALPLLTYNSPEGSYGAEPIPLDFYLTNAPLHFVAQENPDDEILDWRIRCTVNGESFILDRWQTIYLKGFKRGRNWVKLEFLDETGEPIQNAFNTTARLVNYNPGQADSLSKLLAGKLSAEEARSIVDPNYVAPTSATPKPESSEATPTSTPKTEATTVPGSTSPDSPSAEEAEPKAEPVQSDKVKEAATPESSSDKTSAASETKPPADVQQGDKPKETSTTTSAATTPPTVSAPSTAAPAPVSMPSTPEEDTDESPPPQSPIQPSEKVDRRQAEEQTEPTPSDDRIDRSVPSQAPLSPTAETMTDSPSEAAEAPEPPSDKSLAAEPTQSEDPSQQGRLNRAQFGKYFNRFRDQFSADRASVEQDSPTPDKENEGAPLPISETTLPADNESFAPQSEGTTDQLVENAEEATSSGDRSSAEIEATDSVGSGQAELDVETEAAIAPIVR